jgi:prepilin-type N-terminal cleavage/methylation domain-containing protein
MKKANFVRNQNTGFSLVEVMVALALVSMFALLASTTLKDIYEMSKKATNQLDAETDLTFSIRYISKMMTKASPSFNNMKGNLDDNGFEFFDHIYDVPIQSWPDIEQTRTFTMSKDTNKTDLYFLTQSEAQLDQLYYNPPDAYDPIDAIEDMNTASPLKYAALNRGNVISKVIPKVWVEKALILLRVPIPLRYVAADGSVNMRVPPRSHIFLGKVESLDLTQDLFNGHIKNTHPVTNLVVPSADNFLRTVPSVGGASPIVEVIGVDAWKISLQKNPTATGQYDLYSYKYMNGQYTQPFLIAPKVKSVVFKRESVGLHMVNVKMVIQQ